MTLGKSLKRIQESVDWIRELCLHTGQPLPTDGTDTKGPRMHSASCPHDSAAFAAASSAFPALRTYEDDDDKDLFQDEFYEVVTESHACLKQTAMITYICHLCFSVPLTHPVLASAP